MDKLGTALQISDWHGRRYRRFELESPVRIKFQLASMSTEIETVSKNVSIGGLLVRSAFPIPPQTPVTFVLSVCGKQAVRPIHLAGEGEIVRVEAEEGERAGISFALAVKCNAKITQLEEYLATVSGTKKS